MTPINKLLVVDATVYAVDYSGKLNFMAQCADEHSAMLTVGVLATYHKKLDEVYVLEPRTMTIAKVDLKEEG